MKHILSIFLLCLLLSSCGKRTSLVDQLKEEDKVESSYHFYPSTMRMLNFQNVESVDKVVKDVEKLTVLMMDYDSFQYEDLYDFSTQLQEEEAYDLYLEMTSNEFQYVILGKESPQKAMALVSQEENCYIVDITGQVNFMELSNAIKDISETDSLDTGGYAMFFDLVNQDARNKERRKERVREWEKRKAREEAEERGEVYIDPDSILIDTVIESQDSLLN